MKKKALSLLVVDLSTSSATAGARIIPLADYFTQNKHRVSFLINSATKKTYLALLVALEKITITTFPFSDYFPANKILIGLEYLKRVLISPFVKINQRVDVIYSLTGIICDVFPSFVFKKRFNKFWVADVDNIEAPPSKKPGSYLVNLFSFSLFRLSLFFLRYADVIFVTTPLKEVRNTLVRAGINPKKIVLSNNGIPFEYIQKVKVSKKPKYSAVFMGRIHKGKGVFDLIKIWEIILNKFNREEKLLVLGSGDKETTARLKRLIKKKNLTKNIVLAGFIKSEERKYSLLKDSRLFLYPSYYDANPISTVEALACKLPIVAYDLPIFLEHYPKGLLQISSRGDVNHFVNQTLNLLDDKKKRRSLAIKGLKFAKKSSWQEIFKKQEEIILASLAKKRYYIHRLKMPSYKVKRDDAKKAKDI